MADSRPPKKKEVPCRVVPEVEEPDRVRLSQLGAPGYGPIVQVTTYITSLGVWVQPDVVLFFLFFLRGPNWGSHSNPMVGSAEPPAGSLQTCFG